MELSDTPVLLSSFPDKPVYNIKAVCKRTGITAATLRAWERRHKIPLPNRTEQGYRLYSERDIAIIFWLLQEIQSGTNIGQAAAQLHDSLASGSDFEVQIPAASLTAGSGNNTPRSPQAIQTELSEALAQFDERTAVELLAEANALYTAETTLINILSEAFQQVYDHSADATKNFALNYARQWLLNVMQMTPVPRIRQHVVLIGFANEHNEINLLILSLLLRRQGWPVAYLGNDLDPGMLGLALGKMDTNLAVFYADNPDNAAKLADLLPVDTERGRRLIVTYGGQSGQIAPQLQQNLPYKYLGTDLRAITKAITEQLTAMS